MTSILKNDSESFVYFDSTSSERHMLLWYMQTQTLCEVLSESLIFGGLKAQKLPNPTFYIRVCSHKNDDRLGLLQRYSLLQPLNMMNIVNFAFGKLCLAKQATQLSPHYNHRAYSKKSTKYFTPIQSHF